MVNSFRAGGSSKSVQLAALRRQSPPLELADYRAPTNGQIVQRAALRRKVATPAFSGYWLPIFNSLKFSLILGA